MAKPVIFGEFLFRTKKAATEEIRRRINSYEFGSVLSAEDRRFFGELFKLHDEYDVKVDSGIKHIQVEKDFHGNRCLYIYRVDGSKIDISWVHCIRPATAKSTVSKAFRRVVKDAVISFKADCISKGASCPVLGYSLDFDNSHAAYVGLSFETLLSRFLADFGHTYDSIELVNPKPDDNDQRGLLLKDQALQTAWKNYHRDNAKLELWSEEANLRK